MTVRGGKTDLYRKESAEFTFVLSVDVPALRTGQIPHHGMGEFTAKIFTGGAVVFQLSGEHGFQDIGGNDRVHRFLLTAAPQGGVSVIRRRRPGCYGR